jgi:hypothetical protein
LVITVLVSKYKDSIPVVFPFKVLPRFDLDKESPRAAKSAPSRAYYWDGIILPSDDGSVRGVACLLMFSGAIFAFRWFHREDSRCERFDTLWEVTDVWAGVHGKGLILVLINMVVTVATSSCHSNLQISFSNFEIRMSCANSFVVRKFEYANFKIRISGANLIMRIFMIHRVRRWWDSP